MLVAVSLSLVDSLLSDVVAYERDTTVFYFPLMSWVGQQLRQGQLPLWTPQFFGGYPIFADGEIGLAYPPALLALLALPADRALVGLRLAHLAVAAIGMFVFARIWRLPYPSAALAGVVFTLGSFLQAQIHHENIVRTASWMPLLLAFTERALRAPSLRVQLRWAALAALTLGLAGLSLHSQMLAIDLLLLAGYAAFRWAIGPIALPAFSRPWLGRLAVVAGVTAAVVAAGLGMAAVQILPLVELAGFSARGAGIPYAESAAYSLTSVGLLQLIFPYLFRGPANVQWGLWTHWESYLYIGLAPLVLVLVALVCVRRREVAGWAMIAAAGVLLSLGQYSPLDLHYYLWLLPGLSGLRAPGRFTFVVVLAGAMLASHGLAWLIETEARPTASLRRLLRWLWAGLVALGLALVGLHQAVLAWPGLAVDLIQDWYLSLPHDAYPLPVSAVLDGIAWSTDFANPRVIGALLGLGVCIGSLWSWQRGHWRRIWPGAFVGFAAIDLVLFGLAIHPREPLAKIGAEPGAVAAVEQLPSKDAVPNRVLASPALNQVAPDRLAPYGSVQEANGYSSLQFIWHRDYLQRVLYADDQLLDLWNVRYILDPAHYGALANYKGVDYLPQQALLHAPAGGALAEQRFTLNFGSPVGQVRFVTALMGAVEIPQGAPVAELDLLDAADNLVGSAELQAGRDSMDWAAELPNVRASLKHQPVEAAGTTREATGPEPRTRTLSYADLVLPHPVAARTLVLRATPPTGELAVFGAAAIGSDGSVDQLFGKMKSKYRQVYADDEIRVLEDAAAYPRAFVVPRARVAPSLGTALNLMVHQPFQPADEVILADDTTMQSTQLVTDRGGHGTASVTRYAADEVRIHVAADGDAWLVLSDTYYPGWTATVDGQSAAVLRGDVLFRVVAIPAGEHDVDLRFEPASVKLGLLISLVCAAVVVVAFAATLAGGSAARRRTTSP